MLFAKKLLFILTYSTLYICILLPVFFNSHEGLPSGYDSFLNVKV